jgi:AbrB family looped-hinge helix DNA binding protein
VGLEHRPILVAARSPADASFVHARGIVRAMRTTIDKAGRLVIPRALRDRIGLAGGGEVELELDGASVRIEPVSGHDLKEERALLVIPATGTPITGAAVRELIDGDRHGR